MEKYDKIKKQTESTKRCTKILLLLTIVVGSLMVASYFSLFSSSTAFTNSLRSNSNDLSSSNNNNNNNEIILHKEQIKQGQIVRDQNLVNTLTKRVNALDKEVRAIKKTGVIMETDPLSQDRINALKDVTRDLIIAKYGNYKNSNKNYRVQIDLQFPISVPDYTTNIHGQYGTIIIEMTSIIYQPVSIYNFLEIARTFTKGAFNRNAGHVLQSFVKSTAITTSLSFQEYSKEFPHKKGTCGYAGRPSGPDWYISIEDNTNNHGPGSQQKENPYEADANFGTVIDGFNDVVPRIHSIPARGFLDQVNYVKMIKYTILVPEDDTDPTNTKYIPWIDWTK